MRSEKVDIYTHIDGDGLTSARIVDLALFGGKANVFFSPLFSYLDEEVKETLRNSGSRLAVTDIPSSEELMEFLLELIREDKEVVYIDHHPPAVNFDTYRVTGFDIIHNEKYCSATLAYKVFSDFLEGEDKYWAGVWAIVGAYADVSIEEPGSKKVIEDIISEFPELKILVGEQVFWAQRKGEYSYPIASMVGSYLNTPRRLFYHYAMPVAYGAMKEVERMGDPTALLSDVRETIDEAKYPNLALLQYWKDKWVEKRNEVFKNVTTFVIRAGVGAFGVAFVNHPWDLGGYIASIKAESSGIPFFVINRGLPEKVKISARMGNIDEKKINVNPWLRDVHLGNILSNFAVLGGEGFEGGGHEKAGAASCPKNVSNFKIVQLLLKAWNEFFGDGDVGGNL